MSSHCIKCLRIHKYCVCNQLPLINSSLNILIIRHEKESSRPSNTARIAALCLSKATIIDFPCDASELHLDPSKDLLIYPVNDDIVPIKTTTRTPKRLVFLDGTWRQTRKIYKKIEGLQKLPWTILSPSGNPPPKIRKTHFPCGMSTMEAIGRAIGQFEGETQEHLLYKGLSLWIDAVRKNTGITLELKSGEDFTDVRRRASKLGQDLVEQSKDKKSNKASDTVPKISR